jgi:hypothetical protein
MVFQKKYPSPHRWSPLKKNEYIGIIGYFDTAKQENIKESGKKNE